MRNNTRKLWLFIISAALLFILAACGGPTEEPAAEGTSPVQETNEAATPTTVDMDDVTEESAEGETPEEMPEPGIPDPVTPSVVDLSKMTPEPASEEAPREIPAPGVPNSSAIVANNAAQNLAESLGIDVGAVEIVSVQQVEWRDSSLGCPRPGQNYLMVITPGFRIILEADGEQYEYHSDMQGNMVQCRGDVQDGAVER